jgi:hypothetical protein
MDNIGICNVEMGWSCNIGLEAPLALPKAYLPAYLAEVVHMWKWDEVANRPTK